MNFIKIIKKFKKVRIGVVGDLILDRFIAGDVERISPEAPVPVVRLCEEKVRLGGAANTAANIAAFGAQTAVFGAVGDDASGQTLLELLSAEGADTRGVISIPKPTIEKTRIIALGQQIVRLDREDNGELDKESQKLLLAKFSETISTLDAVVVSDYDKGVITADFSRLILKAARKRRVPLIVAPKPPHFSFFRGADVIVPNKKEAEGVIGRVLNREDDWLGAGRTLAKRSAAPVLITRGSEGMSLFENGNVSHIPSAAREVYDVTGAGDTVVAVLSLGLGCGIKLYEAAVLANAAAGIVVGKRGTAVISPEEFRKALTNLKCITKSSHSKHLYG